MVSEKRGVENETRNRSRAEEIAREHGASGAEVEAMSLEELRAALRESHLREAGRELEIEELRETARHRESALEAGNIGLWNWDLPSGRVRYSSEWKRQLGYCEEEIGESLKEWSRRVHPKDLEPALEVLRDCVESRGSGCPSEFRILHRDGSYRWMLSQSSVWCDQNGVPVKVLGVDMDITERKRMEEALRESEEKFRAIADCTINVEILWGLDVRPRWVNSAVERYTGYTVEECLAMPDFLKTIVHPDDRPLLDPVVSRALAEGRGENLNLRCVHKSGRVFWMSISWVPLYDARGRFTGVRTSGVDITERRQAEERLRESEAARREQEALARAGEELRDLLDNINIQIWRMTDESTYGEVNAEHAAFFGLTRDAMLNKSLQDLFDSGPAEERRKRNAAVFASGEAAHSEEWMCNAGGEERCISIQRSPMTGAGGGVNYVVCSGVDITELKRTEEELIRARDKAREAARAKSLFLANMSHEIRTPLNAILGYAQILGRECKGCATGPRLGVISRSGEHLLELINDLLELVRDDVSKVNLTLQVFDFRRVLEDVRLMFAPRAAGKGLRLKFEISPEVPRFVRTDKGKLRQILLNLVGNALKFTKRGLVRVSASVLEAGPDDALIEVGVQDTGCGISPQDRERIFEAFEQGMDDGTPSGGSGLGLALSRRYAVALGGRINLTSEPGEGSCFRLTLRAEVATGAEEERPACGNVRRLAADERSCRVLAVDDDRNSRRMLRAMLEEAGFAVETAGDAAEALERLRDAQGIDVVLMDKRMPGMDGSEGIRRIRELSGGSELPVLMVTATDPADCFGDPSAGSQPDGYISKPVRREHLFAEIGRVTGVRYVYEKPPSEESDAESGLAAEALAMVGTAERDGLEEALRRGDVGGLHRVLDGFAEEHSALAAGIRKLVARYDYERLQRLLDATKGAANE